MAEQPKEEWDDMTQQRRDEILNGVRLAAVMRDLERAEYRGRLARASRSGLTERLSRIPSL